MERRRLAGWPGAVSAPRGGGTPPCQPARTPAFRTKNMLDHLTGLEWMRRVARGEIQGAPFARLLGMRMTEVDEGRVVITAELRPEHENGLGIAHGGLAATLLDSALSCAVNTVMPAGKVFTTLEMKINYIRAIERGVGLLTCTGNVVHAGSRTATAEGRIVDAGGTLYAHGTVTCILFKEKS